MGGSAMRLLLLPIALAVILTAPANAQNTATPDISGTWKLNPAKGTLAPHLGWRAETYVIRCAGSVIRIVGISVNPDGNRSTQAVRFVADGKEHPITTNREGASAVSHWSKASLVTEMTFRRTVPLTLEPTGILEVHITERWTLSSDGRELTTDFDKSDQIFIYDKQ
jgi:hypothetical protein